MTAITKRCTAEERESIKRMSRGLPGTSCLVGGDEPALGTLDQRLDIIIGRLGGRRRLVLTREEKRQLAEATVVELPTEELTA